jgi:hypothetical protein
MRRNRGVLTICGLVLAVACGGRGISSPDNGAGGHASVNTGGVGTGVEEPEPDLEEPSSPVITAGSPGAGGRNARGGASGTAGKASNGGAAVSFGGQPDRPAPNLKCEQPRVLEGGFVSCLNGFTHRAAAGTCPNHAREGDAGASGVGGDSTIGEGGRCETNHDCGGDPLTFCGNPDNWQCGEPADDHVCLRGCESDSDCGANHICLCGNAQLVGLAPIGLCVKATCRTDADCTPGYLCVSSPGIGWEPTFSCQSPADECGGNDDCPSSQGGAPSLGPSLGLACTRQGNKRVCDEPICGP